MTSASFRVRVAIVGLLALAGAGSASAQESAPGSSAPGRPQEWEIAGKASYAAPPVRGGTSPFGAGFGGRLGFTVADVYIGASVVDYLGETDVDAWSHGVLYGGEVGYGFRFKAFGGAFLVLRPQVGVGGLTVFHTTPNTTSGSSTSGSVRTRANVDVITTATGGTSSNSGGSSSGSSGSSSGSAAAATTTTTVSNLYVQPGVTLLLKSEVTFVGVNASMLVIPGVTYGGNDPTTWTSYGLEGQLGLRF
ncbi:MAG: hypothetical protein JWP87_842 [Labilithrix sp.]|nr:hypothetical protein [Labilithrix sp.]